MRTLTLGFPFQAWAVAILGAWLVFLVAFGRHAMVRRLVK
jgi:hypothetical protein